MEIDYGFFNALMSLTLCTLLLSHAQIPQAPPPPVPFNDTDLFQLALNLEYLEAEFYLKSAFGAGLEEFNPELSYGGPQSVGGRKAVLSPDVQRVAEMLGFQEIGHIRIIREFLGKAVFSRPLINISVETWTAFAKKALNLTTSTFDPYSSDIDWLLAAYTIPYVGLTGYVGTNPNLKGTDAKSLLAGVLGVEGGQDAMLRTILWLRRTEIVPTFKLAVAAVAGGFSLARNQVDRAGRVTDEGIEVTPDLGAEMKTTTNILAGSGDSLSYARSPPEVIRIVYGTANASMPGGFFPKGIFGNIGEYYTGHPDL